MSGPFVDQVMSAVAREPRPTPTRAFLSSMAHLSIRDARAALATGWRLATAADRSITPRGQISSSAVLIMIVAMLAVGGWFVAADDFLAPSTPGPAARGPGPEQRGDSEVDLPSPSAEPPDTDVAEHARRSSREKPPHVARESGAGGDHEARDVRKSTPGPRVAVRPRPKEPDHRVVRRPGDRENEPGEDRDRGGEDRDDHTDGDGPHHGGSAEDQEGGGENEGSD